MVNTKNKNSSNSTVFGLWPQTKSIHDLSSKSRPCSFHLDHGCHVRQVLVVTQSCSVTCVLWPYRHLRQRLSWGYWLLKTASLSLKTHNCLQNHRTIFSKKTFARRVFQNIFLHFLAAFWQKQFFGQKKLKIYIMDRVLHHLI